MSASRVGASHGRPQAEPPPRTAHTDAARARCGPRWVFAQPTGKLGPGLAASAGELRAALAHLPAAPTAHVLLAAAPDDELVHVGSWARAWTAHVEAGTRIDDGEQISVRAWRAHAKRLATPSRRSASKAELVATVVSYQLAEIRAAANGAAAFG